MEANITDIYRQRRSEKGGAFSYLIYLCGMGESLLTGAVQVFHFLVIRMTQKYGRTFSIPSRKQVVASYPRKQ